MGKGIHLTSKQKAKIVSLAEQGITQKYIGERFDVSAQTVLSVIKNHRRNHHVRQA